MGGDHKCPVCQATFTRPQHVARHMRSHTGDRPYKCQFCGDQFARSDLLSRHVNKCHADEKPPQNSGGSRRKGVAASRATTSKQACDQCVQSSLPCDGGCPCTKCLHRNRECTFVKFHRQTAPVGPGHQTIPGSVPSHAHPVLPHAPPLYSAPTSTRYNLYPQPQPQDDLLLGPSPTQSIADNLYSPEMSFQTLYTHQGDANSGGAPPIDQVMMQYKLSAEQVRRNSIASSATYDAPPPPEQAQRPSSAEQWMGWDQQQQYHDLSREKDAGHHQQQYVAVPAVSRFQRQPPTPSSSASSSSHGHGAHSLPPSSFPSYILQQRVAPSNSMHTHHHNDQQQQPGRRGSNSGSGGASGHTSATSSSIHLPMGDVNVNVHLPGPGSMSSYDVGSMNLYQGHPQQQQQQQHTQNSNPNESSNQYPTNDPAFSSAFGLMSLDDPAVLAGLASDAQPFFASHNVGVKMEEPDPDTTPLGHPAQSGGGGVGGSAQPPAPGPGHAQRVKDEADSRAVRELWGQYISTPFSGPHSALDEGNDSTGAVKNNISAASGVQRNGPFNVQGHGGLSHRRQRVNSLPSAGRTPVQERYPGLGQDKNPHQNNPSTLRTVHNAEDLRSYEAAVMSRPQPMQLRLPNRKRSVGAGGSKSADTSPMVPARAYSVGGAASSSLAHAFSFGVDMKAPFMRRRGADHMDKQQQEQHVKFKRQGSASSRESSLSVEDRMSVGSVGSGSGSGSGGERLSVRPSFKRLPSQTLGPDTSKRALLAHHRDQEGGDGVGGDGGGGGAGESWGLRANLHLGGSRSLAERRRRMSAPGGLSPTEMTFVGAGHR